MPNKMELKKLRVIAEYDGYEYVKVGYFGGESESEWQRNNSEWMDSVGIWQIGNYYVNVPERKYVKEENFENLYDWNGLMPLIKKMSEDEGIDTENLFLALESLNLEEVRDTVYQLIEMKKGGK